MLEARQLLLNLGYDPLLTTVMSAAVLACFALRDGKPLFLLLKEEGAGHFVYTESTPMNAVMRNHLKRFKVLSAEMVEQIMDARHKAGTQAVTAHISLKDD